MALIISMLTARYLGPSNYGLINYAQSIVTFFSPIAQLGLTGVLVKELIQYPDQEGEIMGTAISLGILSSFICIGNIVLFVSITNFGNIETLLVCVIYSILLIFQACEMIIYWFQAKLLSKYSSIASLAAYLIVSVYKIFLLTTNKSVYWFAISSAMDYMLLAFLLIIMYNIEKGQKFVFSKKVARRMLKESKYYIISNMMIAVYAQTDRIMLKLILSDEIIGYYSAAVTCAGLTGFVFTAIIDSIRPAIFDSKQVSEHEYETKIICLYSVLIYLSLLQSIAYTVLAPYIIKILYGSDYFNAISVLRIIIWYCTFSYLGGARDIWILAEKKQHHLIIIYAVGAISNICLNFVLIPQFGASGAAVATVVTQLFINVIFSAIYKPTRYNGILQLKALHPKYLYLTMSKIKRS